MKLIRNLIIGAVALVALLFAVAAVFFGLIFDPNDYRDSIALQVEKNTGRELKIDGELAVKFFPWVGFDVGRASLGEDPAFGDEDFVSLQSASVRVKLMPLFGRKLEIGQISLDGLEVNLIRNEQGIDNWQSLVDRLASEEESTDSAASSDGATQLTSEGIGGVSVSNASIALVDRQAGSTATLQGFDLSTGSILPGEPVVIETGFDAQLSEGQLAARVELGGVLRRDGDQFTVSEPSMTVNGSNDPATGSIPFADFSLLVSAPSATSDGENHALTSPAVTFSGSGGVDGLNGVSVDFAATSLSAAGQSLRLEAPLINAKIDADGLPAGTPVSVSAAHLAVALDEQTMEFAKYTLQALDFKASGTLSGTSIVDDPYIRGPVRIEPFSPRALLGKLDIPVDTADPKALTSFSGKATLRLGSNSQRLVGMDLKLDDSRIKGKVAIADAKSGAKSFDLDIDAIDLDRYLAPGAAPQEGGGSAADVVEIPAQTLRELQLNGSARIGRMTFSGIESRDVEVGVKASGGNIRVYPSKANLYGGSYSGDIRVDASGEVPVVSMNEKVTNIDFGAFAGTVVEDNPLSGRLTGQLRLQGRGHNTAQIRETLNGETSFNFKDGVIEGIDVMEVLNGIVALVNRTAPTRTPGVKRTQFSQLGGDATVTDGVVATDNLTVAAAALRITGGGTVDLNTRAVDFEIDTQIVESDEVELSDDLRKVAGYKIPVFIGGTYDAPEAGGLDRSAASLATQYGKRRLIDKLFDRDKDDDEQREDGEEAATEEEEPKDPKDELEDQAKDLLKDLLGG